MNVDVSLGSRSYRIVVASGALATVGPRLRELSVGARAALVSDGAVARLYGETLMASLETAGLTVAPIEGPEGGAAKTLAIPQHCWNQLLAGGLGPPTAPRPLGGRGRVGPPQGFRGRPGRWGGRAPSRTQLRPHHRPRARGRHGVRALRPRRGGLAGHRRRGAPRAGARRRRRRDGRTAGTAAGSARAPRPCRGDRRGARRGGDRPRQEGEGRPRPLRAGAQDRRVPSGLRRPGRRRPRGHRVPRIVMPEVGLTTQTSAPYNRLAMSENDQAIVGAIRRQEERLARDPTSLAFAQLAHLYRKAGRTRDAVALCRDGLARYPHYTTARLILAKALAADEQLAAALVELNAILEVSPKDLQCHLLSAEVHRRLGHIDEAGEPLEAAAAGQPGGSATPGR